ERVSRLSLPLSAAPGGMLVSGFVRRICSSSSLFIVVISPPRRGIFQSVVSRVLLHFVRDNNCDFSGGCVRSTIPQSQSVQSRYAVIRSGAVDITGVMPHVTVVRTDSGKVHTPMELPDTTQQPIRIVHLSDTHLQHDHREIKALPDGDVLIHSGDFNQYSARCCARSLHYEDLLHEIDSFFAQYPHQLKIFVAGNHESCLEGATVEQIQSRLTGCTYLCDTSTSYAGVKFYGSPYTAKRFLTSARGFAESWRALKRRWDVIPDDTDVLITHMPPHGILDLASKKLANEWPTLFTIKTAVIPPSTCSTCGFVHPGREHWGCPALRDAVLNRIKPSLHLFGHVHDTNGTLQRDNTVFSNAAFKLRRKLNVFDFYTSQSVDKPWV
ncbi:hypothetical protein BaRGS_00001086, partial [Batillaria attramentaria]